MKEIIFESDEVQTEPKVTLQSLPSEVLINIFSCLDESDLFVLQGLCKRFDNLINDEELWKNLFVSRIHSLSFPSFSKSTKYSTEYVERRKGINQWKHNRAVKTKYVVSPQRNHHLEQTQIENLVFHYPRCACYNDGIITLVQLQSKRQKQRLTYIPCTTPQGCSTMDFNINAAVFGRFDGRVFGKLLSNKSYLTPVTEFNDRHTTCVTAIATSKLNDATKEDWCVSGSENGEIIWWCETKLVKRLKISTKVILKLALYKTWTIAIDEDNFYIINEMSTVHSLPLPEALLHDRNQIHFFKIDFGGELIVISSIKELFVISFNPTKDFGFTKSISFEEATISDIFLDDATSLMEQDTSLTGGDGCYLAVLTNDNKITIINIRSTSGNALKMHTQIDFEGKIFTCQLTNLVLVCAMENILQIVDPTTGLLVKTVQKTDKFPQFLRISQGRMIVGSGNTLHYLQYISDNMLLDGKHGGGSHNGGKSRSNKWKALSSEMQVYNEEERITEERERENERLLRIYGGDLEDDEDEDLQLRIALIESERQQEEQVSANLELSEEEQLRRAIEESQRVHELESNSTNPIEEDEDEEFRRILEQSRLEESLSRNNGQRRGLSHLMDSEASSTTGSTENAGGQQQNQQLNASSTASVDDEELQLAIALSLSELN